MPRSGLLEPRRLSSIASCPPTLSWLDIQEETHTDEFKVVDCCGFGCFFEHVEIDVCTKTSKSTFRIDDIGRHYSSESFSLGLPCKCNDRILYFDNIHRYILFSDMEDLQICECCFLTLGVAIDLNTQKLRVRLPMKFAL